MKDLDFYRAKFEEIDQLAALAGEDRIPGSWRTASEHEAQLLVDRLYFEPLTDAEFRLLDAAHQEWLDRATVVNG